MICFGFLTFFNIIKAILCFFALEIIQHIALIPSNTHPQDGRC